MSDDEFPKDLAIRLANSLTEFLDYFRAGDGPYSVPRSEYAQDVIDAEKVLSEQRGPLSWANWDELDALRRPPESETPNG